MTDVRADNLEYDYRLSMSLKRGPAYFDAWHDGHRRGSDMTRGAVGRARMIIRATIRRPRTLRNNLRYGMAA